MGNQILTRNHPLWEEYIGKLHHAVYAHTEFDSECKCSDDLKMTEQILEHMDEIDTEESLKFIRVKYGICDCRVLKFAT